MWRKTKVKGAFENPSNLQFVLYITRCRLGVRVLQPQNNLFLLKISFSPSLNKISSSISKFQSKFSCMASSSSISSAAGVTQPLKLTGDSFIRPHLRELSPYQPILPFEVLSTRLGRKPEEIVKLDANENPYGPPPEVFEALGQLKFPYIYPDPESRTLRGALAEDSGLESEYILVGCGADELIDLIMRCVLDPGDSIVDCPPTFTMYEFDAAVNCARVIKVPRKMDFSLDVQRITEVIEHEKPKIIFLTSPNNPDGSVISDEVLLKILDLPILVVLDEAYIEFSGLDSKMGWVKKHENLIVLRTFSKRAGLAGLRVGYGAFPLSIIEYLWRAKQPYNVSVAAEVSACAALKNPVYLEKVKVALVQERERLFKLLKQVPFLNPYPSYSNFILCEVTNGRDAKKLKEDLAKMGVMIRHYSNKELKGYVRVSVGKPEQTNALMDCINRLS
ncbi:histidinol-phosphate aminotransferase, chloroplastic isoform X2 [Helianthus annuus]|uniref:histidinol-phosphate aminotransferase, chloroplastic isoform X2 n=1 Tax=Helianthus annuus TaxID=4232 RepID=UPI000B907B18|nr:histidinol-phosphate aminotransferase, chloroplastic isoform X2 [Helianthus annuus]